MTSVEFHQMAWELMANLWKHAGNVLLIFLLTLGADPACHHKYLAVEKTRDFVQLCLESDSKLILETLPGTLHIFGKQKIFRGSPVFIMHEIVMGGEKGVCDLHKRRGELELLLELNRLFLALTLCTFPQEHGFLCEKRLFLNYLLFIYLLFRLLCPIQWEISYLWGQYMVLVGAEGREHAQSTPQSWEALLWWDRTHGQLRWNTWTFLAVLSHPHLPCSALAPSGWWGTEWPDCSFWSTVCMTWMKSQTPKGFSLHSSQHFAPSSSKWLYPLQQQGQCPHPPQQHHLPTF